MQINTAGVRPGKESDAEAIGSMQRSSLVQLLASDGALDEATEKVLAETNFAAAWKEAIVRPPSAAHRVMVAYSGEKIEGFIAIAPDPNRQGWAHIVSLIAPDGDTLDRLLNAGADLAQAGFAQGMTIWALASDSGLVQSLSAAGFAPSGSNRAYQLGQARAIEHLWHASFSAKPNQDVTE